MAFPPLFAPSMWFSISAVVEGNCMALAAEAHAPSSAAVGPREQRTYVAPCHPADPRTFRRAPLTRAFLPLVQGHLPSCARRAHFQTAAALHARSAPTARWPTAALRAVRCAQLERLGTRLPRATFVRPATTRVMELRRARRARLGTRARPHPLWRRVQLATQLRRYRSLARRVRRAMHARTRTSRRLR